MKVKSLKFQSTWFICEDGYVYKLEKGREIKIHIGRTGSGAPCIRHVSGIYKILDLMIEYFIGDISINDRITHRVNKDGTIPLKNIFISKFTSKFSEITTEEESLLHKYGCYKKSLSANARDNQIITAIEVFLAIKAYNFKCIYCDSELDPSDWHLDHYYPLSINGTNKFENIVPSCPTCNIMKSNLNPIQFIKKCIRIANHNLIQDEKVQSKLNCML